MPNLIDLFAGAGGLSLGAARAGFNVSAAVEIDCHAMESHRINFPNTVHIQQDVMRLKGTDILTLANIKQHDLIGVIGGPPCQGFSSIGQGDVNDVRNRLFVKFFQLVQELQPVFFLAENVPGIMNKKYDMIRAEAFAYVHKYTILEPIKVVANEYGAPTTRIRMFFIGYRHDDRLIPFAKGDIESMQVAHNERTTVRQALEGLPDRIRYTERSKGIQKIQKNYSTEPTLQSQFFFEHTTSLRPNGVGDDAYVHNYMHHNIVNGYNPTKHTPVVRNRYAKLKYGQQDKVSKSTKLNPEGYCPTLRAGTGPEKGSYQAVRPIHYRYPRVITPREAARLQGFPDWYKLPDTIWHSFRQLGNSVSPIVAERILSAIRQRLML